MHILLQRIRSYILLAILLLHPVSVLACACGCGVFDVQTDSMFPLHEGGAVWLEYDFMDQHRNWNGSSGAPAADNNDKIIRTDFLTLGGEYMFNREWGIIGTVPYWNRYFKTADDDGNLASFNHGSFGDVSMQAVYSGFSPDMSTGVTFGLKLPTGDDHYAGFDRDTEIGTGSTDLLLGFYHVDRLTKDNQWSWFVNAGLDQPVLAAPGYRPGSEVDATTGVYYEGWKVGSTAFTPVVQIIGSYRLHDRGTEADPDDSGYQRLLFSPGIVVAKGDWSLYASIDLPFYQNVRGNQLTAPELFKFNISHGF